MTKISMEEGEIKEIFKQALLEVLQERKDIFYDVLSEVMEDKSCKRRRNHRVRVQRRNFSDTRRFRLKVDFKRSFNRGKLGGGKSHYYIEGFYNR